MPNYYNCSDGSKVSQATIDRKRSETYRELYEGESHPTCAGCGAMAQATAHLVPQSVCKKEGKSEYCWLPINMVPACHSCNSRLESYKADDVKDLYCYEQLLEITQLISPQRYRLML
jgi:hypothetical protein